MKPILLIKFNANIQINFPFSSSIAEKMDVFENGYRERLPDYHVLAIPVKSEDVEFFDISVLNADKIDPVEFDQLRKEIIDNLMKLV
jgi:hypothetical protein